MEGQWRYLPSYPLYDINKTQPFSCTQRGEGDGAAIAAAPSDWVELILFLISHLVFL